MDAGYFKTKVFRKKVCLSVTLFLFSLFAYDNYEPLWKVRTTGEELESPDHHTGESCPPPTKKHGLMCRNEKQITVLSSWNGGSVITAVSPSLSHSSNAFILISLLIIPHVAHMQLLQMARVVTTLGLEDHKRSVLYVPLYFLKFFKNVEFFFFFLLEDCAETGCELPLACRT